MQHKTAEIRIIVPVRNESSDIQQLLDVLQPFSKQVVLVDGESSDDTVVRCEQLGFAVLHGLPGRARQMNAGARNQEADVYWFLHADCLPPADALKQIHQSIQRGYQWGRFNVRLTGRQVMFRLIERLMNWRSCLTQVATGDQGIFVSRRLFESVGGFPEMPLMEDVAICKLLRKHGRGACLPTELSVSSRRWENGGIFRTIMLMWWLRLRYVMGTSPADLHRDYYGQ
jgi:rSAM/selenodomain-associated transferase 2